MFFHNITLFFFLLRGVFTKLDDKPAPSLSPTDFRWEFCLRCDCDELSLTCVHFTICFFFFFLQWSNTIHQKAFGDLQENVSVCVCEPELPVSCWQLESKTVFSMSVSLLLRAPHTVRSTSENLDFQLSTQEQEKRYKPPHRLKNIQYYHAVHCHILLKIKKIPSHFCFWFPRTEAASSVVKKAAVRQRSYVLSAAKKFEYVWCVQSVNIFIKYK